jgi:excisionase family DNA binding protein
MQIRRPAWKMLPLNELNDCLKPPGRERHLSHGYCASSALFIPAISKRKACPKPMPDDDVLTLREICDLLQVHPSTVYKLLREGRIPSFRIGKEWEIPERRVMRWMAEKSLQARQVRASLDPRANGERRHRRMAGSGRRKRKSSSL